MAGPLEGIRVLDLGMAAVGPIAAEQLGELGADVIKVEQPSGDLLRRRSLQERSYGFTGNNHSKRGIVLDLKNDHDRALAFRLVRTADVLVENFRSPEVLERLGLGWNVLHKLNPRLIYLQSCAYGPTGPMTGLPSNDWTAQATAGPTSVTGQPGGDWEFVRNTSSLDWTGAYVNLEAILVALYVRERTGEGIRIQTSQFQSTLFTSTTRLAEVFAGAQAPGPMGMARPNIVPDQAFATSDGYVTVSVLHDGFWQKLCAAVQRPDLAADPRFERNRARVANRDALLAQLEAIFRGRETAYWVNLLRDADVPVSDFQRSRTQADGLIEDEQALAEGLVTNYVTHWGDMITAEPQWRFDKTKARISRPAPELGEHQEEIVAELTASPTGTR